MGISVKPPKLQNKDAILHFMNCYIISEKNYMIHIFKHICGENTRMTNIIGWAGIIS
jgi:hypothetical protein